MHPGLVVSQSDLSVVDWLINCHIREILRDTYIRTCIGYDAMIRMYVRMHVGMYVRTYARRHVQ